MQDRIDAVYFIGAALYPGSWERLYGQDDTAGVWGAALGDLGGDMVMAGLNELARTAREFPPNPGTFREICITAGRQQKRENDMQANTAASSKQESRKRIYANLVYAKRCAGKLGGIWSANRDEDPELWDFVHSMQVPSSSDPVEHKYCWDRFARELNSKIGA